MIQLANEGRDSCRGRGCRIGRRRRPDIEATGEGVGSPDIEATGVGVGRGAAVSADARLMSTRDSKA